MLTDIIFLIIYENNQPIQHNFKYTVKEVNLFSVQIIHKSYSSHHTLFSPSHSWKDPDGGYSIPWHQLRDRIWTSYTRKISHMTWQDTESLIKERRGVFLFVCFWEDLMLTEKHWGRPKEKIYSFTEDFIYFKTPNYRWSAFICLTVVVAVVFPYVQVILDPVEWSKSLL